MNQSTRRLLVPAEGTKSSNEPDFLVPIQDKNAKAVFVGLKSRCLYQKGLVVFTGNAVTPDDLAARMQRCGFSLDEINAAAELLASYVEQVQIIPIGTKIRIAEGPASTFLFEDAGRIKGRRRKLP